MGRVRPTRARGLSLLELLLALTLAGMLGAGIAAACAMQMRASRLQSLLIVIQQDGRLALERLAEDLRQAYAHACPPRLGDAGREAPFTPRLYLPRWPYPWPDLPAPPPIEHRPNGQAAPLPVSLWLQAYDCDSSTCLPNDPATAGLPPMGRAPGQRVIGSAVLTLRYLDRAAGWAIDGRNNRLVVEQGWLRGLHLALQPMSSGTSPGPWWWLENCRGADIFAAPREGADYRLEDQPQVPAPSGPKLRLYDLRRAWKTVTYYLKVVDLGGGHHTGALMRRVNGEEGAAELVRGIERLDFSYQLADAQRLRYDADAAAVMAASCELGTMPTPTTSACVPARVQRIRVDLLADGESVDAELRRDELSYVYPPDGMTAGAAELASRRARPSEQGFPSHMLRRPFYAVLALREFYP